MTEAQRHDLRRAVLRAMPVELKLGPTATSFELGLLDATEAELNAQHDRLLSFRARVEKSTTLDAPTREAYLHWLDFFERQHSEARQEMETGERRRAWVAQQEARRAEEARLQRYAERIQRP